MRRMRLPSWSMSSTRITGRIKGADGLGLVLQGGVARESFDGEGGQVRRIDLVGVEALVTVLGITTLPQDLAEGHAQMFPQDPGLVGVRGTPLQAVIFSTRRWCRTWVDRGSTRFPG